MLYITTVKILIIIITIVPRGSKPDLSKVWMNFPVFIHSNHLSQFIQANYNYQGNACSIYHHVAYGSDIKQSLEYTEYPLFWVSLRVNLHVQKHTLEYLIEQGMNHDCWFDSTVNLDTRTPCVLEWDKTRSDFRLNLARSCFHS